MAGFMRKMAALVFSRSGGPAIVSTNALQTSRGVRVDATPLRATSVPLPAGLVKNPPNVPQRFDVEALNPVHDISNGGVI